MFSAPQTTSSMRPTFERGVVACENCQTPIVVNNPATVAVEFCVPCPRCGRRGIYFRRMIYIEELAERRKKPR